MSLDLQWTYNKIFCRHFPRLRYFERREHTRSTNRPNHSRQIPTMSTNQTDLLARNFDNLLVCLEALNWKITVD